MDEEKYEILERDAVPLRGCSFCTGQEVRDDECSYEKGSEITEVLPGIKSPYDYPLADEEWLHPHRADEKRFWEIIGKLKELVLWASW